MSKRRKGGRTVELNPRKWAAKNWIVLGLLIVIAFTGMQQFAIIRIQVDDTITVTSDSCGEHVGPTSASAGGTATTYKPYSYYPAAVYSGGYIITAGWVNWCGPGGGCPDGSTLLPEKYILEWKCVNIPATPPTIEPWYTPPPPILPPLPPPTPISGGLASILSWIWEGILLVFDKMIPFLALTGASTVTPGALESYSISLQAPAPDTNCADGFCEFQYGMWGLVDKNKKVMAEGKPIQVTGSYIATATITIPSQPANYVIIAAVTEINMTYANGAWSQGTEHVLATEAFTIAAKAPEPPTPISPGIGGLLAQLIASLKGILCGVAGIFCA